MRDAHSSLALLADPRCDAPSTLLLTEPGLWSGVQSLLLAAELKGEGPHPSQYEQWISKHFLQVCVKYPQPIRGGGVGGLWGSFLNL